MAHFVFSSVLFLLLWTTVHVLSYFLVLIVYFFYYGLWSMVYGLFHPSPQLPPNPQKTAVIEREL